MAEADYCDDYYEYWNDDCDGDCEECNNRDCDEHPQRQKLRKWGRRMTHEIKLQKEFADAVMSGAKNFEVRYNDRGYQKGDYIKFKVMDGSMSVFHPLNNLYYQITYVLSGWGIKEDYVVFGIEYAEYKKEVM